jgi:hypothetical protein
VLNRLEQGRSHWEGYFKQRPKIDLKVISYEDTLEKNSVGRRKNKQSKDLGNNVDSAVSNQIYTVSGRKWERRNLQKITSEVMRIYKLGRLLSDFRSTFYFSLWTWRVTGGTEQRSDMIWFVL